MFCLRLIEGWCGQGLNVRYRHMMYVDFKLLPVFVLSLCYASETSGLAGLATLEISCFATTLPKSPWLHPKHTWTLLCLSVLGRIL